MIKLHLGSGSKYKDGWINIDLGAVKCDLRWDVTNGLPFETDSVDFIYSEHLIEHLDQTQGKALMTECRRVLKTGGIFRVATPDTEYFVKKYLDSLQDDGDGKLVTPEEWKNQSWINEVPEGALLTNACEMLNLCFYNNWGHKFMYDANCLHQYLEEAGFESLSFFAWGFSFNPELENLETREDSKLIMEAIK